MLRIAVSLVAAAALLAAAPAAQAASQLVITGRGFGHGVGLSQYGTLGFAERGWKHDRILRHYYTGTRLAALGASPVVRVLLQSGRGRAVVRGAVAAGGRRLRAGTAYTVTAGGRGLVLRGGGRTLTSAPPLRVTGPARGTLTLAGPAQNGTSDGAYRGALEFRPGGGGVNAINAVALEDYVAGVISAEVPASWPAEALRAQAVAARTYAVTSNAGGDGFTQYADTRSQMYRGVSAEYRATSAAVRATAGRVVTYRGRPVTTFFFSTSGGRTENVENSFLGATPKPWLKSVRDPYDRISPSHTWGPLRFSLTRATTRLGARVKGRLRLIRVTRRGVSPRIVRAQVLGTRGTTAITGPQLRRAFGLRDTWITFRTFATEAAGRTSGRAPADQRRPTEPGGGGRAAASTPVLRGGVAPADAGEWATVERRDARGRWKRAVDVRLGADGAYRTSVPGPGSYRLRYGGATGPAVTAR